MTPVRQDPVEVEVEVRPVSPFRLPRRNGSDGIVQKCGGGLRRLLVKDGAAVDVSVRPCGRGAYRFLAVAVPPERVSGPGSDGLGEADTGKLEAAIADFRFSLGIDEDMTPFRDAFIDDPLLGPAIRDRIQSRPSRRADPWEALAWAVTEQLIEYRRAVAIQRRMVSRWGFKAEVPPVAGTAARPDPSAVVSDRRPRPDWRPRPAWSNGGSGYQGAGGRDPGCLRTAPSPQAIAAASPAELQACDLSAKRALALIRCAKEVVRGRIDLRDSDGDRRLLAIPEIGPWTVACLALRGRGDPDALLAGDLGHIKLVGALAGLGRLAEIEEVEQFYSPYAPFRGIAGDFLLAARGAMVSGSGNRARIRRAARPVRAA